MLNSIRIGYASTVMISLAALLFSSTTQATEI